MLLNTSFYSTLFSVYLIASSQQVRAAENNGDSSTSDRPELEFLEFLGQFETDQGDWVPPNVLMMEEFETLLEAAANDETEPQVNSNGTDNNN